jgi:glycine cleavage system regulatory protein
MRAFRLEILGHDRPGIVREFSTALAMRRINVFEMRSDITSAPMSADPLFTASADIHVPADIDLDELRERLEIIADELLIEYTLSHRA